MNLVGEFELDSAVESGVNLGAESGANVVKYCGVDSGIKIYENRSFQRGLESG